MHDELVYRQLRVTWFLQPQLFAVEDVAMGSVQLPALVAVTQAGLAAHVPTVSCYQPN